MCDDECQCGDCVLYVYICDGCGQVEEDCACYCSFCNLFGHSWDVCSWNEEADDHTLSRLSL